MRASGSSDRLPHTRQLSWGLSLITSHPAHSTACCSLTAFTSILIPLSIMLAVVRGAPFSPEPWIPPPSP